MTLRDHLPLIVARQGGICPWCESPLPRDPYAAEVDHVAPESNGGSDRLENLQALHPYCNKSKGNRPMRAPGWDPDSDPWLARYMEVLLVRAGLPANATVRLLDFLVNAIPSAEPWGWAARRAWEAEAMKRLLALTLLPGYDESPEERSRRNSDPFPSSSAMVRAPVWFWQPSMLEELLSMPVSEDVDLSFHAEGVGIHIPTWSDRGGFQTVIPGSDEPWAYCLAMVIGGDGGAWQYDIRSDGSGGGWRTLRDAAHGRNTAALATALLHQRLVTVTSERAPRAARRPGASPPLDETAVNVVTWRRAEPKDAGPDSDASPAERDKHWWVRGYVQNHWYPKDGVHRPIFIDTFPKGNLNAPLYSRPRVNVVAR